MDEMTGSATGEGPQTDGSSEALPPKRRRTSQRRRVDERLDLIAEDGHLVIWGSERKYIVRVVGSVALGLLGLAALFMGAEGFTALSGVAVFGFFGILCPVLLVKNRQNDYRLELTTDGFSLDRLGRNGKEIMHRVRWADVITVTTAAFGYRSESLNFPAVIVTSAWGIARRPTVRTVFNREIRGEKVMLNQPFDVGRWELVLLLEEAHKRFAPRSDAD